MEPSSLWSRVLRAKYCNNRCDIDMFQARQNASNAWRGIMSSIDVVRKGINMAVGNGARTFFWHHKWATNKPLLELTVVEPPLQLQDATVIEFWDPQVGWLFDKFANFLPADVLQKIAAFELIEDEEAVDEIFWNGSPSGGFTIGSAMKLVHLNPDEEVAVDGTWKIIWQLPVPQRIKFFMWLSYQDRIMSNGNRFLRRLTDDPRCFACGEVEESTLHILRDCPVARLVWRQLGVLTETNQWRGQLKEWLIANLRGQLMDNEESWSRMFSVTCWWLWKWRNDRSFQTTPRIPVDQISFLFARVRQIDLAMKRHAESHNIQRPGRCERYIRWYHLGVGWVKLNTDGASKGNPGPAGAGGLIRGHRGELFEVFAMNCGSCSCTRAELLAVLRGLMVAWGGGHRKVQVEVDSEVVVRLLEGDPPSSSPYIHLIRKCMALISRSDWEVKIMHCFREANRAADLLANFGVTLQEKFVLLEAVPKDLHAVLLEDLGGVSRPRWIPCLREGDLDGRPP